MDEEEIRGEIIKEILDFQLDNPKNLEGLKNFMIKTQADMWEQGPRVVVIYMTISQLKQ